MMEANNIVCPSCGARQPAGGDACSVCGFEFSKEAKSVPGAAVPASTAQGTGKFCPSCGTPTVAGARFCANCGTPLTKGAARPAATGGASAPANKMQSKTIMVALGVIVVIVAGIAILTNALRDTPPATNPKQPVMTGEAPKQEPKMLSQDQMNAIEAFKKSVAENPNDTLALLHLANTLYDVENFREAIPYYASYLKINGTNPDVRVDYAYCLFRGGENEKAVEEIKKAIKINPKHQTAFFNLAIIYFTMNQMEEGTTWLQKCIDVDSTSRVGQEAKNLLSNHSQWLHKQ